MVSIISCRRPSTPENSTGSDSSPTVSPTTGSPKKHIIRITAEQMRWYRAHKKASLRRQAARPTIAVAETAEQTAAAVQQTAGAKRTAGARRKVLAAKTQAAAAAAKQQAPAPAAAAAVTVPAPARRVRIVSTKRRGSS